MKGIVSIRYNYVTILLLEVSRSLCPQDFGQMVEDSVQKTMRAVVQMVLTFISVGVA